MTKDFEKSSISRSHLMWSVAFLIQKTTGMVMSFFLYKDFATLKKDLKADDDTDCLELCVTIHEGKDLVAKDKSFWSQKTSSDPYVKVFHGSRKLGKTPIIMKTLNPVWENPQILRLNVVPRLLDVYSSVECKIFDHDALSSDDSMGVCYVKIPTKLNSKETDWYPVEKGEGDDFCRNATGKMKISVEICTKAGKSKLSNSRGKSKNKFDDESNK
jgi:hypothetical protein